MNRIRVFASVLLASSSWIAVSAQGQVIVPGADGSDGVFNPVTSMEIDLTLALDDAWNGVHPSPGLGLGVYDSAVWAVVFRYSSVNIPAGVTITYKNHSSRAPVVWLVDGDSKTDPQAGQVVIEGTVDLTGARGHFGTELAILAEPGPGGFRGGTGASLATRETGGYGPGGAGANTAYGSTYYGTAGSHGAQGQLATGCGANGGSVGPVYGNATSIPLLGGSGGAGGHQGSKGGGGGSGGGAILIAAAQTVQVDGSVLAPGGDGGDAQGSQTNCVGDGGGGGGGTIRIVANEISGDGFLRAYGGLSYWQPYSANGGAGRIRLEANSILLSDPGNPAYSAALPGTTAILWPDPTAPEIKITSIGGQAAPNDPHARFEFPFQDVDVSSLAPVTVELEGRYFDPAIWNVVVRVVPKVGQDVTLPATFDSGDTSLSTWQAQVPFAQGFTSVQARAFNPSP